MAKIESKVVGLFVNLNGVFVKTEYINNQLKLALDKEATELNGVNVYHQEGYFISQSVKVAGSFKGYEKVITTLANKYGTVNVYTATSRNGLTWSRWKQVGADNVIIEPNELYIRIKIELAAANSETPGILANFTSVKDVKDDQYVTINSGLTSKSNITFIPDIVDTKSIPEGKIFLKKINREDFKVLTNISL